MFPFVVAFVVWSQVAEAQVWNRVLAEVSPSSQPALARTADGVLHIVAASLNPDYSYLHGRMTREGAAVGNPIRVVQDFDAAVDYPALVAVPGTNRVELWFAGVQRPGSQDSAALSGKLRRETFEDGTWRREAQAFSEDSTLAALGTVSVAVGRDGTRWVSTVGPSGPLERNDIRSVPLNPEITGCCAWSPNLAVDSSSGEVAESWFSLASDALGTIVRTVGPVAGTWRVAPGSVTADGETYGTELRSPISGRLGAPGIFLSYVKPVSQTVLLWRLGTDAPVEIAGSEFADAPTIAPGPEGRLWLLWRELDRLVVIRSNKAATAFGPRISLDFAAELENWTRHAADGSLGPLDVLVNNGEAIYHRRVMPLLTTSVSPGEISGQTGGVVTVTVVDAGDAVEGAEVELLGQRVRTDSNGRATIRLNAGTAAGNPEIVVRREGYEVSRVNLRIL